MERKSSLGARGGDDLGSRCRQGRDADVSGVEGRVSPEEGELGRWT